MYNPLSPSFVLQHVNISRNELIKNKGRPQHEKQIKDYQGKAKKPFQLCFDDGTSTGCPSSSDTMASSCMSRVQLILHILQAHWSQGKSSREIVLTVHCLWSQIFSGMPLTCEHHSSSNRKLWHLPQMETIPWHIWSITKALIGYTRGHQFFKTFFPLAW